MRSLKRLLMVCSLFCLWGVPAVWAAPDTMHYQGRLLYAKGQAVSQPVTITFRFYDAISGGNRLGEGFSDADRVTPDAQGYYATEIGDAPGLPLPASIFQHNDVFLNVNVNGENLVPRKRLGNAGYASNADTLAGLQPGRMRFTAAEPVAAGEIVVLNEQGRIQSPKLSGWDTRVQQPAQITWVRPIKLSDERALVADGRSAYITKISGRKITHGPVVTLPHDSRSGYQGLRPVGLDAERALVVSRLRQSGLKESGYLRVLTANGLNLSVGDPVQLFDQQTFGSLAVLLAPLDATHAAFVYTSFNDAAQYTTNYRVLHIDGNVITLGPTHTYPDSLFYPVGAIGMDTARFILFRADDQGGRQAQIVQRAGDDLIFHPAANLDPSMGPSYRIYGEMLTSSKALVQYLNAGEGVHFLECLTVTDNMITTHPTFAPPQASYPDNESLVLSTFAPDRFVIGHRKSTLCFGKVNGVTPSLEPPIYYAPLGMSSAMAPTMISENVVLLTGDYSPAPSPSQVVVYEQRLIDSSDGGSVDYAQRIGVAEQSAAPGEQCLVTIPGGITEQFNALQPGKAYYVSEQGPALTGTYLIGHALTPTKLQVWR